FIAFPVYAENDGCSFGRTADGFQYGKEKGGRKTVLLSETAARSSVPAGIGKRKNTATAAKFFEKTD
ncbi:MAG TPA: hypothetical protein DEB39_00730, partial [Planctomycetaceae bacterium]|nr:hypothetical protein [Planctomycetaceae bacterium]